MVNLKNLLQEVMQIMTEQPLSLHNNGHRMQDEYKYK